MKKTNLSQRIGSHPDRSELLAYALNKSENSKSDVIASHIRECQMCASFDKLYRDFSLAGEPSLVAAPASWMADVYSLCAASNGFLEKQSTLKQSALMDSLKEHLGRLMFDSWAIASPSTVRSLDPPKVRHFRIDGSGVVIDVRAERSADQWNFVAEIVTSDSAHSEFIAHVGSNQIQSNESGFYHWSITRPSQQTKFVSDEMVILLPTLSWRQPLTS